MLYRKILYYWLPPLLWMGIIFYFSSQHKVSITHKFIFDFIIFKFFHLFEYAILYFLWFRALYSINNPNFLLNKKFLLALLISLFYALSDELHQLLIPTREGRIRDVLIDTAGMFLMYTFIRKTFPLIKKFL